MENCSPEEVFEAIKRALAEEFPGAAIEVLPPGREKLLGPQARTFAVERGEERLRQFVIFASSLIDNFEGTSSSNLCRTVATVAEEMRANPDGFRCRVDWVVGRPHLSVLGP